MSSWAARTMLALHTSSSNLPNQNCLLGRGRLPHTGLHPLDLTPVFLSRPHQHSQPGPAFLPKATHRTPICGLPTLVLF